MKSNIGILLKLIASYFIIQFYKMSNQFFFRVLDLKNLYQQLPPVLNTHAISHLTILVNYNDTRLQIGVTNLRLIKGKMFAS